MTFCGHRAVLLVTQDVADTSTSVARERIELRCDSLPGHDGPHRDTARGETWEGEAGRRTTLLRHVTETTESTRSTWTPESGPASLARSPETIKAEGRVSAEVPEEQFDCLTCGACCFQRAGTILVEPTDLVRWRRLGREDILSRLEPGHFGQMAFAMDGRGACVHHGTPAEPHACRIYDVRSETCIRFEAGSQQCREFRRDRGISRHAPRIVTP
jgi:Fe-S-cluster containining protein